MSSYHLPSSPLPSPPLTSGLPEIDPILAAMSAPQQQTTPVKSITNAMKAAAAAQPLPLQAPVIRQFDPNASDDDDEDEDGRPAKKSKQSSRTGDEAGGSKESTDDNGEKGRRKIEIEYIQKKEKRHITFSKRKAGIMKKAYELATLTGTQVLLLVVSETGITTSKFQPLVGAGENGNPSEGQRLIQQCLAVAPEDGSDYISPPPDGPLLPLPPSAAKRPFEANSSIHGGQIALRTRTHRPSARTKARPSAILTGAPETLPNSTPMHMAINDSSPMQPLHSPQRMHSLQQSPSVRDYPSPGLPSGARSDGAMQSAQEYAHMMQRQAMGQGGSPYHHQQQHQQGYPSDYGLHSHHQQHAHLHQQQHQQSSHHMSPEHSHQPHPHHYARPSGPTPHLQHGGGLGEQAQMAMYDQQPSVLMQPPHQRPSHHQDMYQSTQGTYDDGVYMQDRR